MEQPYEPRRNDILPSVEGIAQPQTESVGNFNSVSTGISPGANILGPTAAAAGTTIVGQLRPRGIAKGMTNWYGMCTETLGFESLVDKQADQSSLNISSSSRMTRMFQVMGENSNSQGFPPPLSTLDNRGRRRFNYEKVRSDGRLTIKMVESNKPEIVRTVGDKGELLLKMLTKDIKDQEMTKEEKLKMLTSPDREDINDEEMNEEEKLEMSTIPENQDKDQERMRRKRKRKRKKNKKNENYS